MTIQPNPTEKRSAGRVLVTGAGGFIGSHLAAALVGWGHRVVALDVDLSRLRRTLDRSQEIDLLEGDVVDAHTQERALEGVDTVHHLAAAHLGASVPESEFRRVNIDAVRELAERARLAGVRRFVHCSSVGVYGPLDRVPADESSPCRPELPYEKTKLEGEREIARAVEAGLPAVILRPVWVYGPGCGRTEKLFRTISRGRFVVAGDGGGWRHCVYIDDMVQAFRLAAEREEAVGDTFVIGDAQPVTVRQLVDAIARQCGSEPPRRVPYSLLYTVALGAEWACRPLRREPPLSRRTLRFFTGNTSFSIDRARRRLRFEPRFDLAAGLAETHEALKVAEGE